MTTRTSFRTAAAAVTALGCLLLAYGLGLGPDMSMPAGQHDASDQSEPVHQAGLVFADRPDTPADPSAGLRAGDTGGGAVTYLKVEVPDQGQPLDRGLLQLTSDGERLPGLVELISVPDTSWDPDTLTWTGAPVLGPAVESVRPAPDDEHVVFDVTDPLASRPGMHAFAVTVPADHGYAGFAGPGSGAGEPVVRLSWAGPRPSPSPAATPPGAAPLSTAPEDAVAPRIPPAPPEPPGEPRPVPTGPAPTGPPYPTPSPAPPECVVTELLVPSCGVLWGVAPDAHTGSPRAAALAEYEEATGRQQDIYHAYHRAQMLFPTEEEVAIAAEGRILFLNWKPLNWSWAQIAAGHPTVDAYLDRLADHINRTFDEPFFFTVHHEPENNVRAWSGSGWEATDYAAMFRYVVQRLRDRGVDNLVTVLNHMAYVPWNAQPWFPELYPGNDVVDWLAWNSYAYSDPGYGHGDFAEMLNRQSLQHPDWPGFYTWATERYPGKPFMVGEWGVWYSSNNPGHMAEFYDSVARQTPLFPRIRAMVYFDTPADQRARDSRPTATSAGLAAFQRLGAQPYFQVRLDPPGASSAYPR